MNPACFNVSVYADTFNNKNESTLVWQGDLPSIPREGDVIFVLEDWGGSTVRKVYWDIPRLNIELHIDDPGEEYLRHFGEKAPRKERDA